MTSVPQITAHNRKPPKVQDPLSRLRHEVEEFNLTHGIGQQIYLGRDSEGPGRPGFIIGPARLVTSIVAVVDVAGMEKPVPLAHIVARGPMCASTLDADLDEAFDE